MLQGLMTADYSSHRSQYSSSVSCQIIFYLKCLLNWSGKRARCSRSPCECAVTLMCSRVGRGGSGRLHTFAVSRSALRSALVAAALKTVLAGSQRPLVQIGGRVWRGGTVRRDKCPYINRQSLTYTK